MKHKARSLAGLLLAVAIYLSLPCLMAAATPGTHLAGGAVIHWLTLLALVGGTTVFYTYPTYPSDETGVTAFNTTVAPTAAQAGVFASLSIKFQMLDSETSCTFTHNWALSNTATNRFFPIPIFAAFGVNTAGQTFSVFSVAYNANTIVASKTSGTGSGGTFTCVLLKPHSLIR